MPQNSNPIDWKSRLPVHHPDDGVWSAIEAELDFDEMLAKQLLHLPLYVPDKKIQNGVFNQLPNENRKRFDENIDKLPNENREQLDGVFQSFPNGNRAGFIRLFTTIAASVAVFFVLSFVLIQLHRNSLEPESKLSFSTLIGNDMEQEAIAEIRQYCNLHMPACHQPEFKELMQLYEELTTEQSELNKAILQLGDSPEMIKAMIKIENLKSKTLQELLLMTQS